MVNKRRVTLTLDADVVSALEGMQERSLSAAANAVLRTAVETSAHRAAALDWVRQLSDLHGAPTEQERHEAAGVVGELFDESSAVHRSA